MSREVCGICWCPYDDSGACGCRPQTGATMKRDDIIRMAREATDHLPDADSIRLQGIVLLALDAGEQAEHQQTLALQQRSYEREIQLEVEAEREECAQIADAEASIEGIAQRIAAAIRARTP